MDKTHRYFNQADFILIYAKINFEIDSLESIQKSILNVNNIVLYQTELKYRVLHIAHSTEFYLKAIFLKQGEGINSGNNKTFNLGGLIEIIKNFDDSKFNELFPKVNDREKFEKNLVELNNFRKNFIHNIEQKIMVGPGKIKKFLQILFLIRNSALLILDESKIINKKTD